MRKIKLVVSDFHLGFGRVAEDGGLNELEDFISDQAFVDLLEYYRTGEFVDAEVELILNGDIFEGLNPYDPDDPAPDMITARKSVAKIERIIDGHAEMFAALRVFADAEHRDVTWLVGNHDQDLMWEEVQRTLRERIHPSICFIDEDYEFDGIHVEHGHQVERHNRVDPDRWVITRGLPEPVLNLPWGSDMFVNSLLRFKRLRPYVNRVRPFRIAIWWSLFHDFRVLMIGVWYFIVAVFRARMRRHPERRVSLWRTLRMLVGQAAFPTLEGAARKVLKADHLHTVIFGHTHIPMWRRVLPGKVYINSGTWIPTSNVHISQLGLSLMQTYIYIEYDEKGIPLARLKLWHGRRVVTEDVIL